MEIAVFSSLCVISVIAFLIVRVKVKGIWGLLTKIIASFCFVATGAYASAVLVDGVFGFLVVCGLVCGLIGDALLDLKVVYPEKNTIYLNSGMIAFAIGHAFYFCALISFAGGAMDMLVPVLVSVGVALVFSCSVMMLRKPLKLDFGKFFWQSAIYSFILSFMCVFSIFIAVAFPSLVIFAIGIALFLVSDLILSIMYFGGKQNSNVLCVANHLTYYAAQILIAITLFLI